MASQQRVLGACVSLHQFHFYIPCNKSGKHSLVCEYAEFVHFLMQTAFYHSFIDTKNLFYPKKIVRGVGRSRDKFDHVLQF